MKTDIKLEIKTIDVNAKEWFDKINGNSYFSADITLNFDMDNQQILEMPFQYGYGEHYVDMANQKLQQEGYIKENRPKNGFYYPLWQYCKDNNIILRTNKQENCLKREL